MRGKVLGVDAAAGTGVISGGDGKRYGFVAAEWRGEGIPTPGIYVDFDSADGETATGLFPEVKTVFQPQGVAAAAPPPPPPLSPVEHGSAPPPLAAQPTGGGAPSLHQPNLDKPSGALPAYPPAGGQAYLPPPPGGPGHPGGPAQIRQPFPGQGAPPPYPGQGYPPPQQGGYPQPYQGQGQPGQGHPGQPYPGQPYPGQKSKVVAGVLALFFGSLGVHKFYLGYNSAGAIMLGGTILSFILTLVIIGLLGLMALGVIAFIEAIIYLTKSDADFERIYVQNKRPWF